MKIRQLFNFKNVCKNVKNKHIENGCTDFLVTIIEFLRFYILPNCIRNHHNKSEIDRTIIICLNYRLELSFTDRRTNVQTYGRTDPNYRKPPLLEGYAPFFLSAISFMFKIARWFKLSQFDLN